MSRFLNPSSILRWIVGVSLFLIAGGLAACHPSHLPEKQSPVSSLRVVMDNNYPPYVFQDEQGELRGILLEQWKLWEARTGVKVEITAVPWGEALERMKSGEFDLIDTIFYTADRGRIFDYTDPYAQINVRIFFHKNISGIANAADLKGFRVAVKKGDANVDYLLQRGITDLVYYDNYESIIQAAKKEDVTIFVIDQPPAHYFLYKNGIQNQFNYSEPLYGGEFHRAVRKGDFKTLSLVQDGFARISPAEYRAIDNRWFGSGLTNTLNQILPYLAVGAGIISLVILALAAFNRMLQSQVQSRTQELQEALTNLKSSEMRFRDAIEYLPIPIGIADAQGKILGFNRRFTEFYGYTAEDVPTIVEWAQSAYPDPEYRAKVQSQWDEDVAKAVGTETSTAPREYRVTCKDGSQRDVEIVMHPIGNLRIASFNNVTERLLVANALRESEENYRNLVELSPDTIMVHSEGKVVFINTAGVNLIRAGDSSEVLGLPILNFVHPDLHDVVSDRIRRMRGFGEKVPPLEEQFICLDGSVVDVEVVAMPIQYEGRPAIQVVARDITERKRSIKALQESEERFRTLTENSADALTLLNADGSVFYEGPNVSRLTGYSPSERLGRSAFENVFPDDLPLVKNALEDLLSIPNRSVTLQFRSLRKDGSIWWTDATARNLLHDVSVRGIVVNYRDVTERKQAEEQLRESEHLYRMLFEQASDAIFIETSDDRIVDVNERACEMLGYTKQELMKMPVSALIAPEGAWKGKIVRGELRNHSGRPFESVDLRKDGTRVLVEVTTAVISDQLVLSIVRDITDRKQAQAALQKSEERNRAIVSALPDLLFEFSADGRFLDCIADDSARLLVPREQALGRLARELLPPALAELTLRKIQETLSTGTMQVFEYSLETSGEIQYYESRMSPLSAETVLALVRDITKGKQAEAELRDSETRFRILFEHAGVGVAQIDTQTGRFIRINQKYCDIVGYSYEEMSQRDFQSITHPDDLKIDLENMERLKAGEISEFSMEKRYYCKDGKIVWVLLIVSPLWVPGKPLETHIAVVHDITEKKRTESSLQYSEAEVRQLNTELERRVDERTAQLAAANRELEAFSYSVSHDLRSPLRAIDGFSRIILDEHASRLDADALGLFQHIKAESRRMGQLIDALLNLSRVSRAELRSETVNLSSMARQIVGGLGQSQPQRQVECVIMSGLTVQGDARLLYVVLENLLGNAWKFTSRREKARMEFGVEQRENERVYFVRDDGAGFDLAYVDKLFNAFQRLHRSDEFEGTGIGLATVQRIIHRHGGRVWAESEVDQGATFYFTLG
jgi:PAS domain S-box-containing protein